VLPKPKPALAVVGQDRFQKIPEAPGVTFFYCMDKLMKEHIIDDRRRRHDQAPAHKDPILR